MLADSSINFKCSKGPATDCMSDLQTLRAVTAKGRTHLKRHMTQQIIRKSGADAPELLAAIRSYTRHSPNDTEINSQSKRIDPPDHQFKFADSFILFCFFNDNCKNGACCEYQEQLTWKAADDLAIAIKAVAPQLHVLIGRSARAFNRPCNNSSYDRLIAQARARFESHGTDTSTGDAYFTKHQYHLWSSPEAKRDMAVWLYSIESDVLRALPAPVNILPPYVRMPQDWPTAGPLARLAQHTEASKAPGLRPPPLLATSCTGVQARTQCPPDMRKRPCRPVLFPPTALPLCRSWTKLSHPAPWRQPRILRRPVGLCIEKTLLVTSRAGLLGGGCCGGDSCDRTRRSSRHRHTLTHDGRRGHPP